MDNVKILLADDHAVLRQGLRRILEDRRDWRVVSEASNGRDAVAEAEAQQPHVAVLDIAMPILNGIEATRQIARRAPDIRVLILSMHSDQAYVTQAVQAGAKGYVLKESVGADIIQAVAALAAGKTFFSPPVAEVMLDDYVRSLTEKGIYDRYDALSSREREVLQLVAEGRRHEGDRGPAVDQHGDGRDAPRARAAEAGSEEHRRRRAVRGAPRHRHVGLDGSGCEGPNRPQFGSRLSLGALVRTARLTAPTLAIGLALRGCCGRATSQFRLDTLPLAAIVYVP